MRRLEQRIPCEDYRGRRYVVEVLVNVHQERTLGWPREIDGPRECWLAREGAYRPVQVVRPPDVFKIVGEGTILRRVGGG